MISKIVKVQKCYTTYRQDEQSCNQGHGCGHPEGDDQLHLHGLLRCTECQHRRSGKNDQLLLDLVS